MKSQNLLYALVILALSLLTVTAFSPYGWIAVTSSSGQAPTPIVTGIVVPSATPTSTSAPVPPTPAATFTPGSQGPLAGWKTFTSKLYKYTVSYPSHWTVSIVYFLTRGSSFVLQLMYEGKNYVDIFNQMLAVFKLNQWSSRLMPLARFLIRYLVGVNGEDTGDKRSWPVMLLARTAEYLRTGYSTISLPRSIPIWH